MQKFEKLSRAEMKKIAGGGPPVCLVGNDCILFGSIVSCVAYLPFTGLPCEGYVACGCTLDPEDGCGIIYPDDACSE